MARVIANPSAEGLVQDDLHSVVGLLSDCLSRLRGIEKKKVIPAKLLQSVMQDLDDAIVKLHQIDTRLTGIRTEGEADGR